MEENSRPFIFRFWQYQKERFPFLQHGCLITAFTFSAAAYSRICRKEPNFIPLTHFLLGVLTAILFFFLLRIFDEFKDAKEDAAFRPYRPVPRGLISLKELGFLGFFVIVFQLIINATFIPVILPAYFLALAYMALMTKEFFCTTWLKQHPICYLLSHMLIMPLIDFYTTGLDWIVAQKPPPTGLIFFLIVTFLNGIVIEIGRKIRSPEAEEEGVETYSALYGSAKATKIWLSILTITCFSAILASYFAGFGLIGMCFLLLFWLGCSFPAFRFLKTQQQIKAKKIELAAGIWTIAMYLTLGAVPMLINLFTKN